MSLEITAGNSLIIARLHVHGDSHTHTYGDCVGEIKSMNMIYDNL
jgi:hypothetical protein